MGLNIKQSVFFCFFFNRMKTILSSQTVDIPDNGKNLVVIAHYQDNPEVSGI